MKFCSNCGNEIIYGAVFCGSCGKERGYKPSSCFNCVSEWNETIVYSNHSQYSSNNESVFF